ncbi:MAG TPA: trehalose-phosphatase [Methylomirabilota bacterium]|nr:trehalose-phosphatase [Methylomirabilota bacterium]
MCGFRADEPAAASPSEPDALARRVPRAGYLVLLLDYDGTLVPFARTPELAPPDSALRELLRALGARPRTTVHIVTGRSREVAEAWLGEFGFWLHAEHGLWSRAPGASCWRSVEVPRATWRGEARRILDEFVARTPGSMVEEKSVALAWHYRMADPALGDAMARALSRALRERLEGQPAEVLAGAKVIEVRPRGIHKGRVVPLALAQAPPASMLIAVGDDRTDEDLFAALPANALAIGVGPDVRSAAFRLADVSAVRAFLAALLSR